MRVYFGVALRREGDAEFDFTHILVRRGTPMGAYGRSVVLLVSVHGNNFLFLFSVDARFGFAHIITSFPELFVDSGKRQRINVRAVCSRALRGFKVYGGTFEIPLKLKGGLGQIRSSFPLAGHLLQFLRRSKPPTLWNPVLIQRIGRRLRPCDLTKGTLAAMDFLGVKALLP